ncbi:hypothetical protein GEV33_002871 [Tenebrio molitor]|uniref:PCI domain-containing protein n=1 Tax=Tenebrio molitor TaxID=7067 RepID=A0A8J6LFP3_TENMO|nr:hypothetical protein GEV33_002871 [Tenebrio molitor]
MKKFERIFQENKESLMRDQFIQEHIIDLLKNFRTKILLILIKPYNKIKISFVGQELGISEEETENLIVSCILDKVIAGKIDQLNKVLIMNPKPEPQIYKAMELLSDRIHNLSLCFE